MLILMSVTIIVIYLMIVKLCLKVGVVKKKPVGIKTLSALNVTVRYSFEGNWMRKQHNIIALERVLSAVRISQMLQLI
jgi:hypothetical protein